jgi:hypothetical protein
MFLPRMARLALNGPVAERRVWPSSVNLGGDRLRLDEMAAAACANDVR